MKLRRLPKKILVYQCDEVDGVPIFAVAMRVEDIPEEAAGQRIGTYTLTDMGVFVVHRGLEPPS
jgi:hypothetical protein